MVTNAKQSEAPLTMGVKLTRMGWPPVGWRPETKSDLRTVDEPLEKAEEDRSLRISIRHRGGQLGQYLALHFRHEPFEAAESLSADDYSILSVIRHHCIERRYSCELDERLAAGEAGYKAFVEAAKDILPTGSELLEEFRMWNTEVLQPWHDATPPCVCGTRKGSTMCDVCYQIRTKIKRPWYVATPETRDWYDTQKVCETCSHVDFSYLFSNWCRSVPLATLRDIFSRRDTCSFCRILVQTLKTHYDGGIQFDVKGCSIICTLSSSVIHGTDFLSLVASFDAIVPTPATTLPVDSSERFSQVAPLEEERPRYSFRLYRAADMPDQAGARKVHQTVDFGLLKEWIEKCDVERDASHRVSPRNGSERLFTFQLRVIDVHELRVKVVERPIRYLALSYVWGKNQHYQSTTANKHILESPGGLDCVALPQTIQDAIAVVSSIGERYLWVDRLCIVQNDPEVKNSTIEAMDLVFEGAVATIVADFGDDADAGLLGIRPSRIRTQHREKVQGMTIVNDTTHMRRVPSRWSRRAWTFQEQQLSRRMLTFGAQGVKFSSEFGEFNEQYKQPIGLAPETPEPHIYSWIHKHSNFQCYIWLVNEYTRRAISVSTDALNAFKGIQAHLRPIFRGDFVFGLPVTEIDVALLWQPSSRVRRRRHPVTQNQIFPSWSWAGWEGEVEYPVRALSTEHLSVLTWIDPLSSERFASNNFRDSLATTSQAIWARKYNSIPFLYYDLKEPESLYLHPIAPADERAQRSLTSPENASLIFETLSVMFPISGLPVPPLKEADSRPLQLGLYTSDGIFSGSFRLDEEPLSDQEDQIGEFIAVSLTHVEFGATLLETPEPQSSVPTASKSTLPASSLRPESISDGSSNTIENNFDQLREVIHNRYDSLQVCESNETKDDTTSRSQELFDRAVLDTSNFWCLYNVLLIEWRDGVAYRKGIGICHVDAFHGADPVQRQIILG